MINYNNVPKFDRNVFDEIISIGNSCGVVTCYVLSLIFDFEFDIEEFRNIGEGITDKQIQDYASKNGISYICGVKGQNIQFPNYTTLCENDIVMTISGTNISSNSSHNSIIDWFEGNEFSQLFCNRSNCVTKFSEVKNIYPCFYYKNTDIDKYIKFS